MTTSETTPGHRKLRPSTPPDGRRRQRRATHNVRDLHRLLDAPSSPTPEIVGLTECGQARKSNEDQFLVAELGRTFSVRSSTLPPRGPYAAPTAVRQGWLFAVADGMGGRTAGELAAEVAINSIASRAVAHMPWLNGQTLADPTLLDEWWEETMRISERNVQNQARAENVTGKGSATATIACVSWPHLHVAHVGHGRCYVLRDGKLRRITEDQTIAGVVGIEPCEGSQMSSVVLSDIGSRLFPVSVDNHHEELQRGDLLLLCTDGVSCSLSDEELERQLAPSADTPKETLSHRIQRLLDTADSVGGQDNLTAVAAQF